MAQTVSVLGGTLELAMEGSGGGGSPPSIWPGVPAHPIVLPPEPPPGVWPPPVPAHPIVPAPPHTPPGMIWPGIPTHPIAGPPDRPSQGPGFPTPPIQPTPPTPPEHPSPGPVPPSGGTPGHPLPQKFWTLALVPGYGWYYICVDPAAAFAVEPPTVQPVGGSQSGQSGRRG